MAKNTPAFQFYPSDFMGGVAILDELETGVYIKLLCALWIHGNSIPENDQKLARAASIPIDIFTQIWPSIKEKFVIKDGNVTHARFTKMMEISEIRRESGLSGGRPKAKRKQIKSKTKSKTKANSLKNEERRMKNEEQSTETEDWIFPPGWDTPEVRSALAGWETMRKREKVPIKSKISTSKIFKRFDSPEHLIAAAELCEANSWQGLKPEYGRPIASRGFEPAPQLPPPTGRREV